jgi:tripartite-type tricarboxylate transporter receptor subunit TctC
MLIRRIIGAALVAAPLLWPSAASAQAPWPTKPVKVVVAGAPGSGTDIVARTFTDALAKTFGQPFIVDNKAGANGLIATDAVAKSPNDGYTLLFTYAAAHVVNPVLLDKVPYDVQKDFAAIAQIGAGGNFLIVPAAMPVKDLKEFVAYVKTKGPDELSYGSWGNGSGGHLSMEALKQQTGLKIKHIPYKSTAAANTDLIAGHIDAAFSATASALPLIQAGKVKAIAISGTYDSCHLPDVRNMTRQGITFDLDAWYAMFAPAGTPAAVVNLLNKEIVKLIAQPDMAERWRTIGFCTMPIKSADQFSEQVKKDLREWGAIVKAGNIKAE